jgi:hypothetical protein
LYLFITLVVLAGYFLREKTEETSLKISKKYKRNGEEGQALQNQQ